MLFLCHPTCSTCAKARAFLEARGMAFTERDIRDPNPTVEELTSWIARSGLPVKMTTVDARLLPELEGKIPDLMGLTLQKRNFF